jgi:hypothetical protein
MVDFPSEASLVRVMALLSSDAVDRCISRYSLQRTARDIFHKGPGQRDEPIV